MLFAFAISQSVQAQSNKLDRIKSQAPSVVSVQYACPNHSDKCGMNLNLSRKELLKQENVKNTNIMHPEITSFKNGQCPKENSNIHLSKKEQRKLEIANGYTCPVHSAVSSDKAGTLATCGMYLAKTNTKRD